MIVLSLTLAALLDSPSTVALKMDDRGRPVISAHINDRGPFDMVIDTAAQTSLLVPSLVEELALRPLEGEMTINGAVDAQSARMYPIERISTGLFDDHQLAILALPNGSLTSARGIIGMERFTGSKIAFNVADSTLSIAPSSAAGAGHATVAGATGDNGLLHVPMQLEGVTVQALVDTGAGPSVGNLALLEALGMRWDDPRLKPAGAIRGATQGLSSAWVAQLGTVALGPVVFRNVPIIFSNTDGSPTPSLILGTNLLGLLQGYAVDFPRAELQIQMPTSVEAQSKP
ncbi:hypothetical protein HFK18_13140|uniref:aspartyl protease family protein n=1 Tax=Stenotrophomonas sp. SbOxS2 TaxID=2723885 RepID=UPI0015D11E66|nr:aspartyl protease family protein [Stenotrophomonas sp. SbOxS2]NYT99422.1 hypothetical protein [Stenotrophomonas sp. SbOxS2]